MNAIYNRIYEFIRRLFNKQAKIAYHINKLGGNDLRACERAAEALVRIGKPAVPALTEALKDSRWWVRRYAAKVIGRIGKPAVPALIEIVKDSLFVPKGVKDALVETGGPAVPALIDILKDKKLWWIHDDVAGILGDIGDTRAMPALVDALKYKDSKVRYYAVLAIGDIAKKNPGNIPEVTRVIFALVNALDGRDGGVRCSALGAIAKIGTPAFPALIEMLKDKKWWVRRDAVEIFGRMGDTRAMPALVDALKDKKWWVCRDAAEALDKMMPDLTVVHLGEIKKARRVVRGMLENDNVEEADVLVGLLDRLNKKREEISELKLKLPCGIKKKRKPKRKCVVQ